MFLPLPLLKGFHNKAKWALRGPLTTIGLLGPFVIFLTWESKPIFTLKFKFSCKKNTHTQNLIILHQDPEKSAVRFWQSDSNQNPNVLNAHFHCSYPSSSPNDAANVTPSWEICILPSEFCACLTISSFTKTTVQNSADWQSQLLTRPWGIFINSQLAPAIKIIFGRLSWSMFNLRLDATETRPNLAF